MDFLEMAARRFSVRRFDAARKVEKEKIDRILAAAQAAPSAHNLQSGRILVLEDGRALEKLKSCTPCHYHAPLAFLISYDREVCWKREADGESAGEADAVIMATHMLFEAYEQGVGCCWVMGFDERLLRENFHLPESLKPATILVCGYPSPDCRPSSRHGSRQKVDVLVKYNDYGEAEVDASP